MYVLWTFLVLVSAVQCSPLSYSQAMGRHSKYRDRLEAVLMQLKEDLTTVRAGREELQNEHYRRALRWSGSRVWRRADSHLRATLERQEWTFERIQHTFSPPGCDFDAVLPMPGGVSRTKMTFATFAELA